MEDYPDLMVNLLWLDIQGSELEVIKSISIHSDDIDDSVSSSDQNTDTGYTTTTIVERVFTYD